MIMLKPFAGSDTLNRLRVERFQPLRRLGSSKRQFAPVEKSFRPIGRRTDAAIPRLRELLFEPLR
jgi:hypothetical protein